MEANEPESLTERVERLLVKMSQLEVDAQEVLTTPITLPVLVNGFPEVPDSTGS